jgi:flavin-binding protein dodecin
VGARHAQQTSSQHKETTMDSRTYKLIELVGVSNESYSEATKNAIARASETLRGLGWFEVTELRGLIQNGQISEYQVTLKVGFRLEEGKDAFSDRD